MIYELLKTDTIQNIVNGYQNMNITDGLKGMARTKTNDQLLMVGSQVGNMALPALWISMIIKKIMPKYKDKIMTMTLAECPEITFQQLLDAYDREPDSVKRCLDVGPRELICSSMLNSENEVSKKDSAIALSLRNRLLKEKIPTKLIYEYLSAYSTHLMLMGAQEVAITRTSIPTAVKSSPTNLTSYMSAEFVRKLTYEYLPVVALIHLAECSQMNEIRRLKEECAKQKKLEEDVAIWKGKAAHLERLLSESDETRVNSINEATRGYESEIKSLHDKIDELKDQLKSNEEQIELRDLKISALTDQLSEAEDDFDDIDLPEDNVLVVGGHENWVNKLRLIHPKWTYVAVETKATSLPQNPICVLMFTNHLSHSQYDRVRSAYKDQDVPILYVTCVNLSMLDKQIKRLYRSHVLDT